MRLVTPAILALALSSGFSLAAPQWQVSVQQGVRLKVPVNWRIDATRKGQIALTDPTDQASGTGLLFRWADKQYASSAATLASSMKKDLDVQGLFQLIAQSTEKNVLSQLFLAQYQGKRYYLSTASFAGNRSQAQGWWSTGFMAEENNFNQLGGPMFPFAVLGKVTDQQLAQSIETARKNAVQVQFPATNARGPSSPECHPALTDDPLTNTYNLLSVPEYCKESGAIENAFAIMQKSSEAALDRYKASMIAYNAAWDSYERTVLSVCSGRNARSMAELQQLQSVCQASIRGTTMSMNSWHQTNKGIIYNMGNQPWCYADKNGICH